MKSVLILGKSRLPPYYIGQLIDHLLKYTPNVHICPAEPRHSSSPYPGASYLPVGSTPDYIITLGGDGTLLGASRLFPATCPPILAFALDYSKRSETLSRLFANKLNSLTRSRLSVAYTTRSGKLATMAALNEVLVSNARLDSIGFQLDSGAFSGRVHADGLMLATSTGSTAHSQSAGGPLGPMVLPMQKAVLQPGKYAKVLVDGERIDYGGGNVIVERNEFGIQQFIPDDYLWIKQVERKLGWKTY